MIAPGTLLTLYCAWQARGLPAAWGATPSPLSLAIAFLAWAALAQALRGRRDDEGISLTALLATTAGVLADSGVLRHLGLTLALATRAPASARPLLVVLAASWWPSVEFALGYRTGLATATPRLILAGVLVASLLRRRRRTP